MLLGPTRWGYFWAPERWRYCWASKLLGVLLGDPNVGGTFVLPTMRVLLASIFGDTRGKNISECRGSWTEYSISPGTRRV